MLVRLCCGLHDGAMFRNTPPRVIARFIRATHATGIEGDNGARLPMIRAYHNALIVSPNESGYDARRDTVGWRVHEIASYARVKSCNFSHDAGAPIHSEPPSFARTFADVINFHDKKLK